VIASSRTFRRARGACVNVNLKTIGELHLLPVWVNPNHRVSSAKILLTGHRMRALGVIEGGQLIGTIGFEELVSAPDQDEVRRFVRPLNRTVGPEDSTRAVADLMAAEQQDYIPVADRGQFLGVVTATMLLGELGRSWDPLTGLSWSDGLRDWGIKQLKAGSEVTILFIDLDDFGLYNKKFGHIVGDRVLVKVAEYLSSVADSESDVVVRYGGDEFAIATLRTRRETEELLRSIERGLQGALVADSDQPVAFSAGIYGGRRTRERENVHYSATLDALINMASRGAMAAKVSKRGQKELELAPESGPTLRLEEAAEQEGGKIAVVEVFASGEGSMAMDTVILSQGDRIVSGVHTRGEGSRVESVARATGRAIERLIPEFQVESSRVELIETETGGRCISYEGLAHVGGEIRPIVQTLTVGDDLYRAAAEVVVAAL
jgi:diguanylate cyclase (GGDEF)-like protein